MSGCEDDRHVSLISTEQTTLTRAHMLGQYSKSGVSELEGTREAMDEESGARLTKGLLLSTGSFIPWKARGGVSVAQGLSSSSAQLDGKLRYHQTNVGFCAVPTGVP
jgi:hypothetical protein